jgi:putative inorganic carbon (HCO3(-)) transporter
MDQTKIQSQINIIILICVSVVPLVFIPYGEYFDYFYQSKAHALSILSVIYLLILLRNRQKLNEIFKSDQINISLFFYILFLSISLFFALDLTLAIQGRPYRVDGFSTMIMYFLLFIAARSSKLTISKLAKALLITASILSIYGIFQYFGLDPFPRDFIRESWVVSFATFGNPNFMGSYLVLMIPFAIHMFLKEEKKVGAIVYAILLFCLLSTRTRGAWIGGIIALCSYFIFSFLYEARSKSIFHRYAIITIITVVIIISFNQISGGGFIDRFTSISTETVEVLTNGDSSEKGGAFRIFIWKRVIQLISEKPLFGYGIENLMEPFVENYKEEMIDTLGYILLVDKAHNEYLHIAVTSGIPSLIIYLTFIYQVLKKGIKQIPKVSKYWPIMAAILGYLTQAFFNISVVSVAYIFWILLGLASNYHDVLEITID